MESGSITAISFKKDLYFARGNLFIFPNESKRFKDPIISIIFLNENEIIREYLPDLTEITKELSNSSVNFVLLIFKRYFIIFDLKNRSERCTVTLESNIVDVNIFNKNIQVLLRNGMLLIYNIKEYTESDTIKSNSVKNNSIESDTIKNNSIESDSIKNNSIKCDSIKNNSIESDSIKNNSIESDSIKNNSIECDSILIRHIMTCSIIFKGRIFNKTIISAKIYNDKIFIGSFDSIYQFNIQQENYKQQSADVFLSSVHSGRVFDIVTANDFTCIFTCADDRAIHLNGKPIVQEFRDYFFNLKYQDGKLYTLNRDGFFRIYELTEEFNFSKYDNSNDISLFNVLKYSITPSTTFVGCRQIYSNFFGFNSLTSMEITKEGIFIGTKGGCLFMLKEENIKLIYGETVSTLKLQPKEYFFGDCKYYPCGAVFINGILRYENTSDHQDDHLINSKGQGHENILISIPLSYKPIDCAFIDNHPFSKKEFFNSYEFYLLYKDKILLYYNSQLISIPFNLSLPENIPLKEDLGIMTGISVYKSFIYLFNHSFVFIFYCSENTLFPFRIIKCAKINLVKHGLIGTKTGCISDGKTIYKISEYPIVDIDVTDTILSVTGHTVDATDTILSVTGHTVDATEKTIRILDSHGVLYKCNNKSIFNQNILTSFFNNRNTSANFSSSSIIFDHITLKDIKDSTNLFVNMTVNYKNLQKSAFIFQKSKNGIVKLQKSKEWDLNCNFFDFTAVFNNSLVGTEHGQLFILKYNKIVDYIQLVGSIVGIYKFDKLNELQMNNNVIKEDKKAIKDDESAIKEDKSDIKHENSDKKEDKKAIKDYKNTIKHENNDIKEDKNAIKHDNNTINHDNNNIKHDKKENELYLIHSLDTILVFTNAGFVYSLIINQNKFYIKNYMKFTEKISCSYENKACFSNGKIKTFNEDLTIAVNVSIPIYISCIFKDFISFDGDIKKINPKLASYDFDQKEDKMIKICTRNIYSIKQIGNTFLAAGDGQTLVMFNQDLEILKSKIIHSSQVFDICVTKYFIFTVSSDMRVCVLDNDLNIIKYIKHSVRNPKKLFVIGKLLMIYGESIETIKII